MAGFMVQDMDPRHILEPDEIIIYLRNGQINMIEEDEQGRHTNKELRGSSAHMVHPPAHRSSISP